MIQTRITITSTPTLATPKPSIRLLPMAVRTGPSDSAVW